MSVIKYKKVDLRSSYRTSIKIGFILSFSPIIAAFKFSPNIREKEKIVRSIQDLLTIEDVVNTVQKYDQPKPPERPRIIEVSEEVPKDVLMTDVSINQDAVLDRPIDLPEKQKIIDDEPFINWLKKCRIQ